MEYMFEYCENLKNLNLTLFNTKNVTKIKGIFHGCPKKIYDDNQSKFEKFDYNDMIGETFDLTSFLK